MKTVQIDHVSKIIKNSAVVQDVSMVLAAGKIIGLRGINGSGKTMLMRLVAGLIRPTSGTITIDGKLLGKDMDFPNRMGLLIENPAFLDSYSGYENLKLLASIHDTTGTEQIREALLEVGLDPDDKKKYKKYSLGMKQRLGVAAAVFEQPELVILDEPTNALDTDGIELIKQIVRRQKERGALVLISCHDTDILNDLADEIHFLENGILVETKKEN